MAMEREVLPSTLNAQLGNSQVCVCVCGGGGGGLFP